MRRPVRMAVIMAVPVIVPMIEIMRMPMIVPVCMQCVVVCHDGSLARYRRKVL